MTEMTQYKQGMFCWADLATTDAHSAKEFYTKLFGWNATDFPTGDGGPYTMFDIDGKNVCALYAMEEERKNQGVPPMWQGYVSVENVNKSVHTAQELGANIIMQPMDVMGYGDMAVIQDPTGAMLAFWQPGQHKGADIISEVNSICWNELYTDNLKASRDFYKGLFAWSSVEIAGAIGEVYTEFSIDKQSVAGMLEIQKEWGEMPPSWSVYFQVANLDTTMSQVKDLGGNIASEIMDLKEFGRFCVVQDPQQAYFLVIEMANA